MKQLTYFNLDILMFESKNIIIIIIIETKSGGSWFGHKW